MYNKKRGQSEIITTVLIILLVLAAIVIVWQVVKTTVTTGTGQVQSSADCIGASLTIDSATLSVANNVSINIKRGQDTVNLQKIRVIVENATSGDQICNGLTTSGTVPTALGMSTMGLTPCTKVLVSAAIYNVKIAPVIGTTQCDVADTKKGVTAGV